MDIEIYVFINIIKIKLDFYAKNTFINFKENKDLSPERGKSMPIYEISIQLKNPTDDIEERLHDYDGEIQSSTIIVSPTIINSKLTNSRRVLELVKPVFKNDNNTEGGIAIDLSYKLVEKIVEALEKDFAERGL